MRQFIGDSCPFRAILRIDDRTRLALLAIATCTAPRGGELDRLELKLMEDDREQTQLRYAQALADYADAGGYDVEVIFDACCTEALG